MKSAGIYIHIPFCAVKCNYCDFYSITERESSISKFIKAMTSEIEQCPVDVSGWRFDTIFIGGGTPSLIEAKYIEIILASIDKKYNLSNIKEFTLEANPGEAPLNHLKALKAIGVNRLSIGVQSLQPELLKFLTRIHTRKQIFDTFRNARAVGFQNINCDLIYSIPNQTWEMWEDDLQIIFNLDPEHISAYMLTVEKGTELFKMVAKNKTIMPDDIQNGEWFVKTHEIMISAGYIPYEVSNFSKSGLECLHNLHYWAIDPYLAFGPSAHGFDGYKRWNNSRSLNHYIEKIDSGQSPISKIEELTTLKKVNEYIGFGLRMRKGIDLNKIPKDLQNKFEKNYLLIKGKYPNCIKKFNSKITFSNKGLLFSDKIIPDLLI